MIVFVGDLFVAVQNVFANDGAWAFLEPSVSFVTIFIIFFDDIFIVKVLPFGAKANKFGIPLNRLGEELEDIAGIRIMCQFVDDIDTVVEILRKRTDMKILYEKDYVTNGKPSGYRSYHMIIKYPVNMAEGQKEILAEFQIRTLAMNFWATIEHSLNYKYKQEIPVEIKNKLKSAADAAFKLDEGMLEIKDEIKDAQKLFEVKSDVISTIMNNILTLSSLGKVAEASRYQIMLNNLITEGEVWEFNNLLHSIKKDIAKYN